MEAGTVTFDAVSKRYRLGTLGTLRGTVAALLARRRARGDDGFYALRDVSFRVGPGEALGLIGPNGAGKTTTFKLLSRITRPTSGRIETGGRLASLIELGAGFHPELTGRQNIYLNGAILGLKRREIDRKLDAIVAFSGLEPFIDTPVKRYSSGMYVRLGFAVAAHVEPEILLVDEVLAVGDAAFRHQCFERMKALQERGTTILLVSHSLSQVRRMCPQTLLLLNGHARFLGPTDQAIEQYKAWLLQDTAAPRAVDGRPPDATLLINRLSLSGPEGKTVETVATDEPVTCRLSYRANMVVREPIIKLWLMRDDGQVCGMAASTGKMPPLVLEGEGAIVTTFLPIQLVAGRYYVEARIIDSADSMALAVGQSDWFRVTERHLVNQKERTVFVPNTSWHLEAGTPLARASETAVDGK